MNNYLINKTVPFKFRGIDLQFDLSPGLFSSAGIDTGTKLLLKVFSSIIDDDTASGKPLPQRVLDAGCGTGVIGICAAAALSAANLTDTSATSPQDGGLLVRCQDRDELARLLTLRNAAQNGIPPASLEAYTEPLLACSPGWDLIFTNIPAKTGTPVLEDFIRRSVSMLNPGGRVIMVAVNTLADFFRERIAAAAELEREEKGPGHTVFVYGSHTSDFSPQAQRHEGTKEDTDFFARYPFYVRTTVTCPIEDIPIHLETIHGAGGFDSPGGAVLAAAKLTANLIKADRVKLQFPLLIHEPGQGFFPCWLNHFLKEPHTSDFSPQAPRHEGTKENSVFLRAFVPPCEKIPTKEYAYSDYYLSGRNILALEAAAHNVKQNNEITAMIIPVMDLSFGVPSLLESAGGQKYGCIIAFPELLPQSSLPKTVRQENDQLTTLWNALPSLLSENGIFLAAFGSSDAERFDRKKPTGFSRLGSIKRNGFRALAYNKLTTNSEQ
jgi:precorrin-6B methylase 2